VISVGQVGTVVYVSDMINGPLLIATQTGYATDLPPGRYRVRTTRVWTDITWCAAGKLLDAADIETARAEGTVGETPEEIHSASGGHMGSVERLRQRFASFDPSRVLFARADFEADDAAHAREEHAHPGLPAPIPPDSWDPPAD